MAHRYYTLMRPPAPGAIPKGATEVEDFGGQRVFEEGRGGFAAWGWCEYDEPLTDEQVEAYELRRAD